ncbi:MAG TPA: hypothetical protein VHA56_20525 [Mucilaginibacter sp.]|nr:hypothetical protein [Mucilaginibacter sp.]
MYSFIFNSWLTNFLQVFWRRACFRSVILVALFALSTHRVKAAVPFWQESIVRQELLPDSLPVKIKDSLKLDLLQAKIHDPVKKRRYLVKLLKEERSQEKRLKKRHGERFYYGLAVAFTKLRLYSLAMKCYFKTLTVESAIDTGNYQPLLLTASIDSKQLMADNFSRMQDSLMKEDSLALRVMSIHNADIGMINKDSTAYNGDSEIRSPRIAAGEIINPFEDGKTAAAYAMLIHVRQPVSGSRKIYVLNNVGHTFITLIKYNTDSTIVSRSFGFYPRKDFLLAATPLFPSSPSTFKNDERHSWDEISGTFISRRRFNRMLEIVKKYDHKKYQLSHRNCTDFGLEMAAEAGIVISDAQGKWPLGKGNNPACAGQSILEGRISAMNGSNGKLLIVNDLVNTKTTNHYRK